MGVVGFKTDYLDCEISENEISFKEKESLKKYDIPLSFIDNVSINVRKGFFSNDYNITVFSFKEVDFILTIENFVSSYGAESYKKKIEAAITDYVENFIIQNSEVYLSVSKTIKKTLKQDNYLPLKTGFNLPEFHYNILTHHYLKKDQLPIEVQNSINIILSTFSEIKKILNEHNQNFFKGARKKYDYLFANIEKYPLSEEQISAILSDEERYLLIAGAGSGKSSTILAKAVYLVESGLATPDEILVLVYNSGAKEELNLRFNEKVGVTPNYNIPVVARTFHGLGSDILLDVEKCKPSVSIFATSGPVQLAKLFKELVDELISSDDNFNNKWCEYLAIFKKPALDLFTDIQNYKDYNRYLSDLGAYWKKFDDEWRLKLNTIGGKEVNSFEEVRIANWLTLNGVEFEYERRYELATGTEGYRQYYPDFYYPEASLYHEHFALNRNGRAPVFFKDYEKGVEWKRRLHTKQQTKLIETYSYQVSEGSVFEELKNHLIHHGVKFKPKKTQEVNKLIAEIFNPSSDYKLFMSFMRHLKANSYNFDDVRKIASNAPDRTRHIIFIEIFETIFKAYQKKLTTNNEIDFEDMINKACQYIEEKKYNPEYKYILVDEFQDISQDRKRMILALLNQKDTKFFAVGDDWQSIYRFSGADINIMTKFSQHFGTAVEGYLTQTYRSFKGIVDVASEFIQKNPNQLKKALKAHEDKKNSQVFILEYESDLEQHSQIKGLLYRINQKAIMNNQVVSIFLLSRYNHLNPKALIRELSRLENIKLSFKTIHAAKGLEADYVILLNVEYGVYGFPSLVSDDPILNMIIPEPENFLNAEERRLMYVAITRAKRAAYLSSNKKKQSVFIEELTNISRVQKQEYCLKETYTTPPVNQKTMQNNHENYHVAFERNETYIKRLDNIKHGKPARSHFPWKDQEISNLLKLHNSGLKIDEIAIKLMRSPAAISAKLRNLGIITETEHQKTLSMVP